MLHHVRAPRLDHVALPGTLRRIGAAGLLAAGLIGLAVPGALAQATDPAGTAPGALSATSDAAPPAADQGPISINTLQSKLGKEKAARIESHITTLHASLRITPAQEPLWQNFAGVMRQTVVQMDAVYAKRQGGHGSMNAVQDLQSYGEVEDTNARNVQQLLPPFKALYDSFSAEQKKTADNAFERYTDKAVKKSN
ncbi:Spy/CpxP family protein refolding chaperone [Lichenicola sp.]|uniref:Spy/CpxP family protein refolding chaperone n=1 Tax=Lichenicola sp. TaxID=2804529 RepID=UPI003B0035BE